MKSKERLTGKPFEDLIFKIYKGLEPLATIKKNDKIKGVESGMEREIDISLRQDFGGHKILMIIQAKDHKKKADIKILGEFDSVIRDVRASRGILICNAGFTKTAKEYAKNRGIDLCTAHDASIKNWRGEIKIPVIRTRRIVTYKLFFPFKVTQEFIDKNGPKFQNIQFKTGPDGIILTDGAGNETNFLQIFLRLWSEDKIEKKGQHRIKLNAYLELFLEASLAATDPVEVEYTVNTRHYLKFLTPIDYRGIKDYVTEKFSPSFIRIREAIPFHDDKSWQYIPDPATLALEALRLEIDIVQIDNVNMAKATWVE